MIAVVSSAPRERLALLALCESRNWACGECDSVRSLVRLLRRSIPRVIVTRHKLDDGYSDDVIAAICAAKPSATTKTIVLLSAGMTASTEARQVAMGADCVQRDPVRIDVLLAYISKFLSASNGRRPPPQRANLQKIPFCLGNLNVLERTLQHRGRSVQITPREVALIELLSGSPGQVITYETLYGEILGRRFHGDTSNMRVLLGKLSASARSLGIPLNQWIDVIPKTGYNYRG